MKVLYFFVNSKKITMFILLSLYNNFEINYENLVISLKLKTPFDVEKSRVINHTNVIELLVTVCQHSITVFVHCALMAHS